MKLLVIIVTYNALKWIDKCLKSVRESTIYADIFVVDNGSTDGTQDYIKEHFPETIFIQSEENLGFGKANNIGLQFALDNEYDFIYLLNQDAWVYNNTFELLINGFNVDSSFGILSPMQYQSNGKILDSSFEKCLLNSNVLSSLPTDVLQDDYWSYPIEVNMTMAAHWMLSRACVKQVGGFSPTFPHYGEDVNYNDRIHYWGLKMGIVPSAKAVHDRETRIESAEKLLYMYKMSEYAILSNPNYRRKPWLLCFLSHVWFFISNYRIYSYIFNFYFILSNMSIIKKNKKISKTPCAFLNEK